MRACREKYSSLLLVTPSLLPAPNARDLMVDLRHSLPARSCLHGIRPANCVTGSRSWPVIAISTTNPLR